METSILRTVGFAVIVFFMNNLAVSAQNPFYDTKWEDGKVVSKTKYVMVCYGMYEQESVSKYTYDENGDFLKKEVYVWNPEYVWIEKGNRHYPDYSEKNWTPQYRIKQERNFNLVSLELAFWNKETKEYSKPIETVIYQLNFLNNRLNYLVRKKGDKVVEEINNIEFNKELFAELVGRVENTQK